MIFGGELFQTPDWRMSYNPGCILHRPHAEVNAEGFENVR